MAFGAIRYSVSISLAGYLLRMTGNEASLFAEVNIPGDYLIRQLEYRIVNIMRQFLEVMCVCPSAKECNSSHTIYHLSRYQHIIIGKLKGNGGNDTVH